MLWNELILSMLDNDGVWDDEFEVNHAHHAKRDEDNSKVVGQLLLVPAFGEPIDQGEHPVA